MDANGYTVPNDGCLNFVDENDEVLLAGFGRKGKAKGDIPGVRFKGWSSPFKEIIATANKSQLLRFLVSVFLLSGRRRRRSRDHRCGAHGKWHWFGNKHEIHPSLLTIPTIANQVLAMSHRKQREIPR